METTATRSAQGRWGLALSTLHDVIDRCARLDAVVAGDATAVGEMLSAACQLQLDVQGAPPAAESHEARHLARELCSTLSHVGPGRHGEARTAEVLLRRLAALLDPDAVAA